MQKLGNRFLLVPDRRFMHGCALPRSSDNQTVINRIMLRFRPIAPKPAGSKDDSGTAEESRGIAAGRRVKRKYVRVRDRQNKLCPKRKNTDEKKLSPPEKFCVEEETPPEKRYMTLQLLEDRSESEKNSCESSVLKSQENLTDPCDGAGDVNNKVRAESGGSTADSRSVRSAIESSIVVECVTEKFTAAGLGFSDKEKIRNLEQDTCPGFVSDWTNNVIWVNEAYKRMVAEGGEVAAERGFLVRLVVKEELPYICPSFACRVRVTQQKGQGHKWNKIVPCDVWRLEFAGFAWKLDVNTALTLGF